MVDAQKLCKIMFGKWQPRSSSNRTELWAWRAFSNEYKWEWNRQLEVEVLDIPIEQQISEENLQKQNTDNEDVYEGEITGDERESNEITGMRKTNGDDNNN